MANPPFIEASVVQTTEDKKQILTFLEKRTKNFDKVEIQWKGTKEEPILRVIFPSEQALIKIYTQDHMIYEKVIHLFNEGIITPTKTTQTFIEDTSSDELYLILKYTTNFRDPLRNNYQFTYKIAEMLGIGMSYEEVDNGFILFYKGEEDFKIGQIDLRSLEKVKERLELRGHWNPKYEKLWDNAMKK